MKWIAKTPFLAAVTMAGLLGAVPAHVPTADYFAGYAGTKNVAPEIAARWLTWAEVGIPGSQQMRPLGVKTLLYTDPNRQMTGEPMYTPDESTFAHDCGGNRVPTRRAGQYVMDPRSQSMRGVWKNHVARYDGEGHFSAIFEDDANDLAYIASQPCNVDAKEWREATIAAQRNVGRPVVYNGLSLFDGHGVSKSIALNASAVGGMMEECYASSPTTPKVGDWQWAATEDTEIQMARARKYFFCYGNDTSPAESSTDNRLYVYASYLLTYDPHTSVLWEYYRTPSGFHVMPETQFVPLNPVRRTVRRASDLRNRDGVYVREYKNCYLAGRKAGKCAVVVNPDAVEHRISLRGFTHVLSLNGSGVVDGGTATLAGSSMPQSLPPLSAAIAVR